jgi:hypothetical protein
VWRAQIVLLSGDGLGTMAIQRQTGKGKQRRPRSLSDRVSRHARVGRCHQRECDTDI